MSSSDSFRPSYSCDDHSCVVDDYSHLVASSFIVAASKSSSYLMVALEPRLVSGTAGSIVSSLITQPFEVAKVKQQNFKPCPHMALYSSSLATTPGTISMIRRVIAQEGVRGAYAGIAPTMVMSVPNYLLFLSSYDEIAFRLRNSSNMQSVVKHTSISEETSIPIIGGSLARVIATTAVAPLELLRTRAASVSSVTASSTARQEPPGSHMWTELVKIVKTEGILALYRGIAPALARDVPFAALYMLCLERFRDSSRPLLLNHGDTKNVSDELVCNPRRRMAFEFTNAALAGMVAATCTAPLDIIKTRFQNAKNGKSNSRKGIIHVIRSIVQQDGIMGLWRGNQARMLKVAPQYAIMISFYEVSKSFLGTGDT